MKKYSLHIALNRVDPFTYGGWSGELNACHADAESMSLIAMERGYQVSYLLSEFATMSNVLRAIKDLALLATAGDTVLITYSGHGGQLRDKSGDESDGLDETWVLFDGMILDDQLHQAYAMFKKGVRIIVVSDSCHSGSVIKVAHMAQNSAKLMHETPKAAPDQICRAYATTFTAPTKLWRPRVRASMVLLSACQDNQFAYDGDENGLFTATLLKVYDEGKFAGGYSLFRKKIASLMPPEQTPQLLTMGAKNKDFLFSPIFS